MDFGIILNPLQDLLIDDLWEKMGKTFQAEKDKVELWQRIQTLAERKRPSFERLDLYEEYDWDGLNTFLKEQIRSPKDNLFLDSFNLPERRQREWAWKHLLSRAQSAAGATTPASKQAVCQYVTLVREAVQGFFLQQVDDRDLFLCGMAVGDVLQEMEQFLQKYHNELKQEIRYHGSFAQFLDNIQMPTQSQNPLHYRNSYLRFQGRKAELHILHQFLQCEGDVKWMAVTGNGGMGKSKLLYHFVQEAESDPNWKTCWLSAGHVNSLSNYTTDLYYRYNILLIVDYAGESAKQLGQWLVQATTNASRTEKIRVILLEREPVRPTAPDPQWYQALLGTVSQARIIKGLCYAPSPEEVVLQLSPLDEVALKTLIADYASARDGKILDDPRQAQILKWAQMIDRKHTPPLPLVVLMTTDAVLDGKTARRWSIENLLEHILNRHEQHWQTLTGKDETLYRALVAVLCYATATGGWELGNDLPEPLTEQAEQLLNLDASKLEALVSAVNQQSAVSSRLLPLEPDLIGEYFVLRRWSEQKYNKSALSALIALLWCKPFEFAIFLDRCTDDYLENREFQWLWKNGMELLQPVPESPLATRYYAMLLFNLSNKQPLEKAEETINTLQKLSQKHSDSSEITLEYAKGLFNLSCDQELKEAEATIDRLQELSQSYPNSSEIALEYAKGLVNLSYKQPLEKAAETIKSLQELSQKHSDSSEIALAYAKGLFNLSYKQPLEKAEATIDRLQELSQSYPNFSEIALEYANGLFNLSCDQELKEAEATIDRLQELSQSYPNSSEIALRYANGLFNLSNKQSLEKAAETIKSLRELSQSYPDSSEIALEYAKGLVNLCIRQPLETAAKTVADLRKFLNTRLTKYPDEQWIQELLDLLQDDH